MAALRTTLMIVFLASSVAAVGAVIHRNMPHLYFVGSYWKHPIP